MAGEPHGIFLACDGIFVFLYFCHFFALFIIIFAFLPFFQLTSDSVPTSQQDRRDEKRKNKNHIYTHTQMTDDDDNDIIRIAKMYRMMMMNDD